MILVAIIAILRKQESHLTYMIAYDFFLCYVITHVTSGLLTVWELQMRL